MIHSRIIASVWMLFGVIGGIASEADGFRQLSGGAEFDGGPNASLLIGLPFCLFAIAAGAGLFLGQRWAVVGVRVIAVILLLYCASFVLMSHFSFAWVGLFGIAFAAYTLLVAGKCKLRDTAAKE